MEEKTSFSTINKLCCTLNLHRVSYRGKYHGQRQLSSHVREFQGSGYYITAAIITHKELGVFPAGKESINDALRRLHLTNI